MDKMTTQLHEALSADVLKEIAEETSRRMAISHHQLSERAQMMADKDVYQNLLDYSYEQIDQYFESPDNFVKVLTDSRNIQPVYNSIAESPEFQALCPPEYKGFPRVILMTVLAGSESAAADAAYEYFAKKDPEVAGYFDQLVGVYQQYLQDALRYGKGEDKTVMMTGKKQ